MTDQEHPNSEYRVVPVARNSRDIYGPEGATWKLLRKSAAPTDAKPTDPSQPEVSTNQGVAVGIRRPLIDKMAARDLRDFNTTQSACIDAKASATVGLGHRDESIHEILDPLCQFSWQDTLDALADDYWETGECFLECVLDPTDPTLVTGLFHVESAQCAIEVESENNSQLYHYVVTGETHAGMTTVMAKWGDLEALKARFGVPSGASTAAQPAGGQGGPPQDTNSVNANDAQANRRSSISGNIVNSVIIHIRQGRNRSRWYGFPDYMSAVPSIELVQCMTQHEFDFYFNRGVPEFLAFFIGRNMGTEAWKKIENMFKAGQGLGKSHKTAAVHIPGTPDENKVQIEKLAMEDSGQNGFSDKSTTLAMLITTAHGVPPMLANVALPAKIGAVNEGPNALLLIQKRKIGPAQRNFSTMLARTLGSGLVKFNQPDGAPKSLTAEQFLGPKKAPAPPAPPAPPAAQPGTPGVSALLKSAVTASQDAAGATFPKPDPQLAASAGAPGGGGSGLGPVDENGMPVHVQSGNGFKTILDGLTLGAANTMASMKEPMAGSGRNPADGLLTSAQDRKPGDPKAQP